jgi:putative MATE family efflux protein
MELTAQHRRIRRTLLHHKNPAIPSDKLLFPDKALLALLIPLMAEQFLNTLMGMADTVMVSRVGSVAISAVSLTDSINTLAIQIFSALAAGGTILCSQYLGQKSETRSNQAARQTAVSVLIISLAVSFLALVFRVPLLNIVFGQVSSEVMNASVRYFTITVLSYPFFAMAQVGGALFRACGNSRFPMKVALLSNLINIVGNALLIFVFNMGVAGAALSTLASRIFYMTVILYALNQDKQKIVLNHYSAIRPDPSMIRKVLIIGVPAGVENGMFQFGKLAIQSSVSTLGTTAIAAQALASIFENLNGVAGIGIGIGLMTVVGQCVGAGRREEARYYVIKLSAYAEAAVFAACLILFVFSKPIILLSGMEPDAAALCFRMLIIITIVKPLLWVPSFIPPYGFRAAGDVRFSMIVSTLSMWLCRVVLTVVLIRVFHLGIISVWIGMFTDWGVRGIIYSVHFLNRKWMKFSIA